MAKQMEYPPRKIISMIRAGMRDEVLSSSSMWYCLSCYLCTVRCPRGVKPTELAHALESLASECGYEVKQTHAPAMYQRFVDSIRSYGRVHELGMMTGFYLSIVPYLVSHPMVALKLLPLGLVLLRHKRLPLMPKKVKAKEELSQIIQKFREVRSRQ
jgi:heterodisulfide reductase subunit C